MISFDETAKRTRVALAMLWIVGAAGCGESTPKVIPVSGKLLVNGNPAAGATVFFHPRGGEIPKAGRPMGAVQPDGSFHATTFVQDDGLPQGEYELTATWPTRQVVKGEVIEGPDQLRGKYSSTSRPLATIVVAEGKSELEPIELRIP